MTHAGGPKIRWSPSESKLARLRASSVRPEQYFFPLCGLVPSVDCRTAEAVLTAPVRRRERVVGWTYLMLLASSNFGLDHFSDYFFRTLSSFSQTESNVALASKLARIDPPEVLLPQIG